MKSYITKSEAEIQKKTIKDKGAYLFGELHPYLFENGIVEKKKEEGETSILITYIGKYEVDCTVFKKAKCPICKKEELTVYYCTASVLSGCHVLRGYCDNCNEFIAYHDNDYYHYLRDYILDNVHKPNKDAQKRCLIGNDGKIVEI